jgi:hypothetical protein
MTGLHFCFRGLKDAYPVTLFATSIFLKNFIRSQFFAIFNNSIILSIQKIDMAHFYHSAQQKLNTVKPLIEGPLQ